MRNKFKIGNKFGKGRTPLTEEQKKLKRKLSQLNGRLILAKYCIMAHPELKKCIRDPNIPIIDLMILRLLERAIAKAELPILIWVYGQLGWNNEESNTDQDDKKPTLIIRLDKEKNPKDLEIK